MSAPIRVAVAALAAGLLAAACDLSVEFDTSSATSLSTTTTVPAAREERPRPTTAIPTTSLPGAPAETTPTTETPRDLLPIPSAVTEPPPDAGPWGDVVVHVETFLDEVFADFAGEGTYRPLDRDRIVSVTDDDRSLPSCDRGGLRRRTVEDNALAAVCGEGQLVAWDEDDLFADLLDEFGETGPTIVIAHEFGHVLQAQAGVLGRLPSVFAEQQADCLAGAYAAWAWDRGIPPFDQPHALDDAVGATVTFRDEPGSSAASRNAHGSGFDRVRAFQDGFDRGAGYCASYEDTPPPITEIPFSEEDFPTGGNLPFDALVELVGPYIETFFAGRIPGWRPLDLSAEALEAWQREHVAIGDNYTGTRLAMRYAVAAQDLLGEPNAGEGPFLQQACAAGGVFNSLFFPDPADPPDLRLSAGDLDEAVITLSRLVEEADFGDGFLFEAVAALRVGFTDGFEICGLP